MSVRLLTKELQQKAERELGEVPSRVQKDLNHIREWLSKQPHLKARTDDQWLLGFLRSCKFSLQRTKDKLDLFYTMRKLVPEFFANRDPLLPEIQEILKLGIIVVLPKTVDPAGPRIITTRCRRAVPESVSVVTVIKVLLMILEILFLEDDNYTVAGLCFFVDFRNLSFKHAAQVTPTCIKKIVKCLQDAYPVRAKGAHFVNTPSFLVTLFNTLKILLTKKNRKKVTFYTENNINDVHTEIPFSILPTEYGGTGGSCAEIVAQWKLKMESYRDWFLEDAQFCTDETKRPGKPKTSELFGVEGSFKKFEID